MQIEGADLRAADSRLEKDKVPLLRGDTHHHLTLGGAPVFVAVSGRAVSLPLFDSMVFLGSDITRMRLREALTALGVSGKQRKRLEKSYRLYDAWLVEQKRMPPKGSK